MDHGSGQEDTGAEAQHDGDGELDPDAETNLGGLNEISRTDGQTNRIWVRASSINYWTNTERGAFCFATPDNRWRVFHHGPYMWMLWLVQTCMFNMTRLKTHWPQKPVLLQRKRQQFGLQRILGLNG